MEQEPAPYVRRRLPVGWAVLLALLLLVGAAAAGWTLAARAHRQAPAGQGLTFRLASLDGRRLGPGDFPGKTLVVEFWATWCAPCRLQAAILEEMYPRYRREGVEFLAVNLGEEADLVRQFVADSPFSYPVLLDPRQELGQKVGVYALPTVLVLDPRGKTVYLEPGIADEATLRRALEQAATASPSPAG